jgi:hypothetical protein
MLHRQLLVFLTISTAPAVAAASASPIFKCTVNGQTVLADRPCDGPPATVPAPGVAAPSASEPVSSQIFGAQTIVGDWRGQTQFQGAENAQVMDVAHSVVPLVLTFSADGKVSGVSADNGCSLLGLWAPAQRRDCLTWTSHSRVAALQALIAAMLAL